MGPTQLAEELRARGYTVDVQTDFVIVADYEVEVGRFSGRKIRLAFQTPTDYNITPPGGFHVSPHLVAIGVNAVHQSPLGPDFQYWSRPIHEWSKSRNLARILSNINAVLNGV